MLKPKSTLQVFYQWLIPRAQELDQNPLLLKRALKKLVDLGLLGLDISKQFNGLGVNKVEKNAIY